MITVQDESSHTQPRGILLNDKISLPYNSSNEPLDSSNIETSTSYEISSDAKTTSLIEKNLSSSGRSSSSTLSSVVSESADIYLIHFLKSKWHFKRCMLSTNFKMYEFFISS